MAAKQYKKIEDLVPDFENYIERSEEKSYWTVEYRYHKQIIDNKYHFDTYGEAKKESLTFLKERIEVLRKRKPLKKDSKEFTNFVTYLLTLSESQILNLRDQLIKNGTITITKEDL